MSVQLPAFSNSTLTAMLVPVAAKVSDMYLPSDRLNLISLIVFSSLFYNVIKLVISLIHHKVMRFRLEHIVDIQLQLAVCRQVFVRMLLFVRPLLVAPD